MLLGQEVGLLPAWVASAEQICSTQLQMGMETMLFLFHRSNRSLNIYFLSSLSDFVSTVPAQIGQKKKMSYLSVFEVVHNIVITFPYF